MNLIEKGFRRTGVSFLFRKWSDFIKTKDIQMKLVERDELPAVETIDTYNQMFCCSQDMVELVVLSRYDRFINFYSNFMSSHFGLIKLQSNLLLIWNLALFFLTLMVFVYDLFFIFILSTIDKQTLNPEFKIAVNIIMTFLFLIDMLLIRPRIAIYLKEQQITEQSQLIRYYIAHFLFPDLVAIITLLIDLADSGYLIQSKILFYIKTVTLIQINKQISFKLFTHKVIRVIYRVMKLICFLVLITFVFSCIYFLIDINLLFQQGFQYSIGHLWLIGSPSLQETDLYDNFNWYIWFEYALLFIMETAKGCGYGTAGPRNPPEVFFTCVSVLTLLLIFALYTRAIIDIIEQYGQKHLLSQKDLMKFSLQNQKFSLPAKSVQKYRNFISLNKSKKLKQEHQLMNLALPNNYFIDLNYIVKQHFLLRSKFLGWLAEIDQKSEFLVDVAQIVKFKELHENQYIFRKNTLGKEILYLSEFRQIVVKREEIGYKTIRSEWVFTGVREFFYNKKSLFDAYAKTPALVQYLEKDDLLLILSKYRTIYQRYCEKMNEIKFQQGSSEIIQLKCWFCPGYHMYEQCRMLFGWMKDFLVKGMDVPIREAKPDEKKPRVKINRKQINQFRVQNQCYRALLVDKIYPTKSYFTHFNL